MEATSFHPDKESVCWVESPETRREGSISVEVPTDESWSKPFAETILPILKHARRLCTDPLRKANLIVTFPPGNEPPMKSFADINQEQRVKVSGAITPYSFILRGKRVVEFDAPVIIALNRGALKEEERRYPQTPPHLTALGTILHELGEVNYNIQHPESLGEPARTARTDYTEHPREQAADKWALGILRKELVPEIRLSSDGFFILP